MSTQALTPAAAIEVKNFSFNYGAASNFAPVLTGFDMCVVFSRTHTRRLASRPSPKNRHLPV